MQLPRLTELQPRERLLAVLGSAAVFIVLLDRVVLSPWARHSRMVRQEIRTLEQTLQTHQRLFARQDRVFAELEQYQSYLKPAIADDLQMAALLKEVEVLAGQAHVQVSEVKPLTVETEEIAKRYALEVRFECSLEEWVDFVSQIESSPSLYAIARAGLTTQEDVPDQLQGYLRVVSTAVRAGGLSAGDPQGPQVASAQQARP